MLLHPAKEAPNPKAPMENITTTAPFEMVSIGLKRPTLHKTRQHKWWLKRFTMILYHDLDFQPAYTVIKKENLRTISSVNCVSCLAIPSLTPALPPSREWASWEDEPHAIVHVMKTFRSKETKVGWIAQQNDPHIQLYWRKVKPQQSYWWEESCAQHSHWHLRN